jgi:hypothetical protein
MSFVAQSCISDYGFDLKVYEQYHLHQSPQNIRLTLMKKVTTLLNSTFLYSINAMNRRPNTASICHEGYSTLLKKVRMGRRQNL